MSRHGVRRNRWGLPEAFRPVPRPRCVDPMAGSDLAPDRVREIRLGEGVERPVLGALLSALPATGRGGPGCVSLELSADAGVPESPEGYCLEASEDGFVVRSRGGPGLFYGCATLEQLLEDARDAGMGLPPCRIRDEPAVAYRAVHIDVKHHLDTMKYYYDAIDRLAALKINAVMFEFEDKLRYRRRPAVGGPLSIGIEEMAALSRYAARRNIEISPLVQGLGHATFVLKHDLYSHLREREESRWAFCPLREETYELLFDLYRDAMDATPESRYLHVGGDEVEHLGSCPRCRELAEREGELGLFLAWLNRVCGFIRSSGRMPVFWDDMVFKAAGVWETMCRDLPTKDVDAAWESGVMRLDAIVERLPSEAIAMRWNYSHGRQDGNVRALAWYRDRGVAIWVATAAQCGGMMLLPAADQVANIRSFVSLAAETGIPGILCTAWDDRSPHMETYWRGWMAAAESAWNGQGTDLDAFEKAHLQRAFGPAGAEDTVLYAELDAVCGEPWSTLLAPSGTRDHPGEPLDLPEDDTPGEWIRRHAGRIAAAAACLQRQRRLSERIVRLCARAVRGRYCLRVLHAVSELAVTPAELLTALASCDVAQGALRGSEFRAVEEALAVFEQRWARVLQVYGESRFLAYPPGFVADRYFHPASRREDLTWLIELEEELHPRVRQWLGRRGGGANP